MARIFITGSSDGLGLNAARALLDDGHEVVLHARSRSRAREIGEAADRALAVVTGDLSRRDETLALAEQVNAIGTMDAVIHNAGVYGGPGREESPDGCPRILAVNVLAPYLLTAKINRPDRLIYVSSNMHRGHGGALDDMDWSKRRWNTTTSYGESKLLVAAHGAAVARHWADVLCNTIDPGWVPTRMGGPSASDDLEAGHLTQTWLAVSNDAEAKTTGGFWHHRKRRKPAPEVDDPDFQDTLLEKLRLMTGVSLL